MIRINILIAGLILSCLNTFPQNSKYTTFGNSKGIVYDLCFSKGGSWLAVAENQTATIYDVNTSQSVSKFEGGHQQIILAIDLSSDSALLVTGGKDKKVVIWDVNSKKILKTLDYHQGAVTTVKFSPDNKFLASGSENGQIVIYSLSDNKIEKEFSGSGKDITTIAFSRDSQKFAFAGADKTITLLNTSSWTVITTLNNQKGWVREIIFSQDGSKLISCGDDSRVLVWNLSNLNGSIQSAEGSRGSRWLLGVDMTPNNSAIVSAGLSGKIKIQVSQSTYSLKTGKVVQKVRFKPNTGEFMKVVAATRGAGVIIADANNMRTSYLGHFAKPYNW